MIRFTAGGAILMGILSILNCRGFVHKLKTGDGDFGREIPITHNKYEQIKIGATTAEDLDRIFENKATHRWTYKRPFWATWEGQRYRINGIRTYGHISYAAPVERPGMMVYGWVERRYIEVYLGDGVVQFYLFRHDVRDERGEPTTGPLQNYDESIDEWERMTGTGCARQIYDVVSLGREPSSPTRFEKYCRPLIVEDGE